MHNEAKQELIKLVKENDELQQQAMAKIISKGEPDRKTSRKLFKRVMRVIKRHAKKNDYITALHALVNAATIVSREATMLTPTRGPHWASGCRFVAMNTMGAALQTSCAVAAADIMAERTSPEQMKKTITNVLSALKPDDDPPPCGYDPTRPSLN